MPACIYTTTILLFPRSLRKRMAYMAMPRAANVRVDRYRCRKGEKSLFHYECHTKMISTDYQLTHGEVIRA